MARDQWDPAVYLRRAPERARPFGELLARIDADPADVRTVVDLGCGPGTLTASLAHRYPSARVLGIDSSAAMIARTPTRDRVEFAVGDVTAWMPDDDVDIAISNAVLQWIPDHPDLLARWAGALRPGGWLAVQVPGNHGAPSHVAVRDVAEAWHDRLAGVDESGPVLDPAAYAALLAAAGCRVDAWETTYVHVLPDDGDRHPVLDWLEGTTLRPVVDTLTPDEYAAFAAELTARLDVDYPIENDLVWYPFRRIFVVARKTS
ncbi:methyltransferase domain-containing protein [Cryptosporangium sp. NPDC048952]|uniref:methyltransferase domain-containing protein n=1 Tax=Cryptosporangium sp. NPDC048952 TaxID=3363961 RepID=UPI0037224B4C